MAAGFLATLAESLVFGFCAGLCVVAGLSVLQKRRSRIRMDRAANMAALSRATAEDLRKLIPKESFPSWVQFPEFERVNWLNRELNEIWPYLNKATSAVIRAQVEPILEQYRPAVFQSLRFQKLTLGTFAPQFEGIKMVESGPNEIVMEVDFKWGGNPSVILAVQTYLGVPLPVQVKDVEFCGVFRIAFTPLVDELPCFGAVTVALSKKPILDFTLNIIGGDVKSIPGLKNTIDGLIRTAVVDSLLWPSRVVVPILPGDYRHLELHQEGQLIVKLVEGRDLINVDMFGKSDPYAIVYVRPIPRLMKKSRTQANTLNPIWNEEFVLEVEDPASQRLVISVMDEEELQQSRPLGQVALLLKQCPPGELQDLWLPLVLDVDEPQRGSETKRGEVHIEVLYVRLDEDDYPPGVAPVGKPRSALERELGLVAGSSAAAGWRAEKYQRGVLMVTIVGARDLVAKDFNGLSDPYVALQTQLGSIKKRTKVAERTLNPTWDDTFEFLVEDARHDMLLVDVWDHDMFGRDFIGRLGVTLTRVMREEDYTQEYRLSNVPNGFLTVRMKWKGLS